jgi:hypothetical protein
LTTKDFHHIFAQAQHSQENRTKQLVQSATMKQRADAMESVFAPLTVRFVIPNLTHDEALSMDTARAIAGQRIESLPMPRRDRYIPYNDELPAKPLNKAFLIDFSFALVQLLLSYLAFLPSITTKYRAATLGNVVPDRYLNAIVDYYAPTHGSLADGLSHAPLSGTFFIPIILVWILEGSRRGNVGALCSWYVLNAWQFVESYSPRTRPATLLLMAAYTVVEPAKILPLYFLLAIWNSSRSIYHSVMGRPVSISVATAMIPTCAIYAVYLALFCSTPAIRQTLKHYTTDMLPFFPIFIFAVIQLLAALIKPWTQPAVEKEYMTVYLNKDYPPLTIWYRIIIILSFLGTFLGPSSSYHQHGVITTSIVAHCLHSAFQLRNLGYAKTRQAAIAMVMIILGTIVLGPVTTYLGFWYWRENIIYRLSK